MRLPAVFAVVVGGTFDWAVVDDAVFGVRVTPHLHSCRAERDACRVDLLRCASGFGVDPASVIQCDHRANLFG